MKTKTPVTTPIRIHAAIVLLALFSGVAFAQMPEEEEEDVPKPVVGVSEVVVTDSVQSRRYTGQVVSKSVVNVMSRVSGEIIELGFNEGDFVKKGQMLYKIETIQYEVAVKQAEANIAECKAKLEYAQSSYDRNQRLFAANAASKDNIENSKAELNALKASLAAAEAALVAAQEDLKHTTITAPIDGQVGLALYTAGNYVTPDSGSLLTMIQMQPIRVRFSISAGDFLSMYGSLDALKKNGRIALLLADDSEYTAEGTIEFLNNTANERTGTIQVFVSFPNDDLKLIPGTMVTVTLSKKADAPMPAVPPSAIMHDEDESYVYILASGNKIERRVVELGELTRKLQLIKSGVKPGERVVSKGTHKVMPGDQVILDTERAQSADEDEPM